MARKFFANLMTRIAREVGVEIENGGVAVGIALIANQGGAEAEIDVGAGAVTTGDAVGVGTGAV